MHRRALNTPAPIIYQLFIWSGPCLAQTVRAPPQGHRCSDRRLDLSDAISLPRMLPSKPSLVKPLVANAPGERPYSSVASTRRSSPDCAENHNGRCQTLAARCACGCRSTSISISSSGPPASSSVYGLTYPGPALPHSSPPWPIEQSQQQGTTRAGSGLGLLDKDQPSNRLRPAPRPSFSNDIIL